MSRSDPAPGWFRKHFNEDYRIIYAGRNQEEADVEAARVVKELGIRPGERVLDLCCGHGRHLTALAKHGVRAVGVDLSMALLRQIPPTGATPGGKRAVCADMRALPFAGSIAGRIHGFSAVVNFFTSFGYFETDDENFLAVCEVARVLEPGGRFSLDLMNAGPAVRSLEPRTERRAGSFRVIEERRYDAARRRIEKRITIGQDGSSHARDYFESVRVYSPDEIASLLAAAGLEATRMLGDFAGRPHDPGSPRMIVLGRKQR